MITALILKTLPKVLLSFYFQTRNTKPRSASNPTFFPCHSTFLVIS